MARPKQLGIVHNFCIAGLVAILFLSFIPLMPQNKTFADSVSSISLTAYFTTCCYGFIQIQGEVQNATASGNDEIHIQGFAPDNSLVYDEMLPITPQFQGGFLIERQYVNGSYTIVATYGNATTRQVVPPFSSQFKVPPIVGAYVKKNADGSVLFNSLVRDGIENEPMSVAIYSPNNQLVTTLSGRLSVHPHFDAFMDADQARSTFSQAGTYRIVFMHIPTGIQGETTLVYTNSSSSTSPNPPNPTTSNTTSTTTTQSNNQQTTTASSSSSSSAPSTTTNNNSQTQKQTRTSSVTTTQTENKKSQSSTIIVNGTIGSSTFINRQLYIIYGNWSMMTNESNSQSKKADFAANFTMSRIDGNDDRHYSVKSSSPLDANGSLSFLLANNNATTISSLTSQSMLVKGAVDVKEHGSTRIAASGAGTNNMAATISATKLFDIIKLDLAKSFKQPIYGIVDSISCNGSKVPLVEYVDFGWMGFFPKKIEVQPTELPTCMNLPH